MAKPPPSNSLDALVAAAGKATAARSAASVSSNAELATGSATPDMHALIRESERSLGIDSPPSKAKVGAGDTAQQRAGNPSLEQLTNLAQQGLASHAAAPAATARREDDAAASTRADISRMVAEASGISLGGDRLETATPIATTPRPALPTALPGNPRNVGPWVAAIMLLVVLGYGTAWLVENYWPVDAPLVQKQPLFSVAPERRHLIPLLIAARNEVETYRKRHGSIPKTVGVKAEGVEFLISIRSKGYFIAAVQGNYILALTDDGKWLSLGSR